MARSLLKTDLLGQRFGRLVVIARPIFELPGRKKWLCRCDCGAEALVITKNLTNGNTKSCGCLRIDKLAGTRESTAGKPRKKRVRVTDAKPARSHVCGYSCSPEGLMEKLIRRYRLAAENRNLLFDLSDSDIRTFVKSDCFYCGAKPRPASQKACGAYVHANGIDRKDSSEGYILDNCVAACSKCNFAKRDMSISDFRDWVLRTAKFISMNNHL